MAGPAQRWIHGRSGYSPMGSSSNLLKRAGGVLVTISVSHYCEKARWALERFQLPFEERRHVPILHMPAAYFASGKGSSTPIFKSATVTLTDSADILKFVDTFAPPAAKLYPPAKENEINEWETMFNRRLGPAVRLACYFHLLGLPLCYSMFTYRVSLLERVIAYPLMPLIMFLMRKALRLNDKSYARSVEYIRDIFRQVSERLSDGRPFLCGGDFTAADLTFAALGAPIVLAPNYGGQLPTRDLLPPELVALADELRATAAGSHILRLYEHERLKLI